MRGSDEIDIVGGVRPIRGEVRREEDHEEWGDQIVDTLHVPRRRVAQGPDVKDALEGTLNHLVVEEAGRGRGAWHIHQDLVKRVTLVLRALVVGDVEVLRHRRPVLTPPVLVGKVANPHIGCELRQSPEAATSFRAAEAAEAMLCKTPQGT